MIQMTDLKPVILNINDKLSNLILERQKMTEERNELLDKKFKNEIEFESNKSEKILETNFKKKFGKDNDNLRNSFIRKECKKEIESIEELEKLLSQNKNKINQIDIEINVNKNLFNGLLELLKIEKIGIEDLK